VNERIQELLDKATYDVLGVKQVDQKQFAELIIRECVNVALEQKKWVENQEVFNSNDEAWNRARIQQSQYIVDKITQHFGVEE